MASLRGKEILVLTDVADLATQIRQILEADGALVQEARLARKGLTLAEEILPHLIILDLNLTGSAAITFLSEFKKHRKLARIPVLTLAQSGEKELIVRATQLGAADCLLKPVYIPLFLEKMGKLLVTSPYETKSFIPGSAPEARLTVPAEIVTVEESGFFVEALVMLGLEAETEIDAPLLKQLGCADATLRTTTRIPRPADDGGYVNEINLLGITPQVAKAIRNHIRERAQERVPG